MFDKDTNKTYIKSMLYFVIQICFVFLLTSMFYIYIRETFNVLLNINKKDKSTAGFAMFVTGLIVFYILGIIIQEAMVTEGNTIIALFFAVCTKLSLDLYTPSFLNTNLSYSLFVMILSSTKSLL